MPTFNTRILVYQNRSQWVALSPTFSLAAYGDSEQEAVDEPLAILQREVRGNATSRMVALTVPETEEWGTMEPLGVEEDDPFEIMGIYMTESREETTPEVIRGAELFERAQLAVQIAKTLLPNASRHTLENQAHLYVTHMTGEALRHYHRLITAPGSAPEQPEVTPTADRFNLID